METIQEASLGGERSLTGGGKRNESVENKIFEK